MPWPTRGAWRAATERLRWRRDSKTARRKRRESRQAVRDFVDEVNKELAVTDPDLRMAVNFDGTRFTSDAINETELTVLLQ